MIYSYIFFKFDKCDRQFYDLQSKFRNQHIIKRFKNIWKS